MNICKTKNITSFKQPYRKTGNVSKSFSFNRLPSLQNLIVKENETCTRIQVSTFTLILLLLNIITLFQISTLLQKFQLPRGVISHHEDLTTTSFLPQHLFFSAAIHNYIQQAYFQERRLPLPTFHIETSHLICSANKINGFYTQCHTGLEWVKWKYYHTPFP